MPLNTEFYRQNAQRLWDERWTFVADMNGDGAATFKDVWPWVKWVFWAPGDFVFLNLMFYTPEIAAFFQLSVGGTGSTIVSLLFWFMVLKTRL